MRLVTLTCFCCGCAFVGACLFPSLDGLSGDAGTVDAPNDSITGVDAGTDAPETEAGFFCPQAGAILCSDFDEPDASVTGDWGFGYAPGTATMELSTAFWTTPPRSLLIATTGTDQSAGLSKSVGFNKGVSLEFDMYIVSLGGNPSVCSFAIGGDTLHIQPHATSTGLLESTQLSDGGTNYDGTSGTIVAAIGGWTHVVFDFDLPTLDATITFGGALVATRHVTDTDWSTATSVTVGLGIGSSAGETLYYDDVTIRIR